MAFDEELEELEYPRIVMLLLFILVAVAIYGWCFYAVLSYYNPSDDWLYCQRSKPDLNLSGTRAELCYTEYWPEYCKMTYPKWCPDRIQKRPELEVIQW